MSRDEPTTYYDSVTGKPLFVAPIGRTMDEFLAESNVHGWPSFRDSEVVWANTRSRTDSVPSLRPLPSLRSPRGHPVLCRPTRARGARAREERHCR